MTCRKATTMGKSVAEVCSSYMKWGNATILETTQHVGFYADALGYRTVLTRNVPEFTKNAIGST